MSPASLPAGLAVRVRAPASAANLGPGFDSVGLALGVWDSCVVRTRPEPGLLVEVAGEGADGVPRDASHLVHRSLQRALAGLGIPPPGGLELSCVNAVPHGRGMGSSATAIVTGIVAAQALEAAALGAPAGPVRLDPGFANDLAARLEGHPDNSSATVFGGATLSWTADDGSGTRTVRLRVHPDVVPVVFAPEAQLSTARARSVLPTQVLLPDAAADAGRVGLLVHALADDPSELLAGTRDWLHQEPRRGSYPESMGLVDTLRAAGHPAVISGAGPSVLVLATRWTVEAVRAFGAPGWRVLTPGIPGQGAHAEILAPAGRTSTTP